jgi:SAM-dependent methyltransferase
VASTSSLGALKLVLREENPDARAAFHGVRGIMRGFLGLAARWTWSAACFGLPKGAHITRYSMYREIQARIQPQDLGDKILSISHSTELCRLLGADQDSIVEANYPDERINQLSFQSEIFSAVVSDQVLEHVECTPNEAIEEVWRVLRPGGIAIHTTCFLAPYHGSTDFSDFSNGDFWRFTPSGLSRLHSRYSKVLAADGWGNGFMPLMGALGLTRMPIPDVSWHPLNWLARANRPSYAFVVWVVARK